MSLRGPLARFVVVLALVGAAVTAVAGGLTLGGPGLVAVGLAAALAACTAAGIAREAGRDRRSVVENAAQVAACTVGVLLVASGIAALAGGAVAVLAVATALLGLATVYVIRGRRAAAGASRPGVEPRVAFRPARAESAGRPEPVGTPPVFPPVAALSTAALGREWLRTTAVLAARLDAATRQSVVARRQEALDELERRDPVGFARWLAAGPEPGSDPADYLRSGPVADTDAA